MSNVNVGDENVPHEAKVADAIDDHMARTSNNAAIPDLASPGASYVQAEAVAARDKINLILEVLREAELIPSS
jgi:hypothetical protein